MPRCPRCGGNSFRYVKSPSFNLIWWPGQDTAGTIKIKICIICKLEITIE